jgi:BirA family biotin operon repressor/biotin-[acetyl-CoA-carboxylase] ligase
MISEERIRNCLTTSRFGRDLRVFRRVDSTNVWARDLAEHGVAEGTLVIAEEQTAGRGRLGRSWLSNPGENLTFSLVLRPRPSQPGSGLLPLAIGVAVARAIEGAVDLRVECKWPNDLLVEGQKVAGILMETSVDTTGAPYVIVGIGLNVNQTFFAEEIRNRATSLKAWTRTELDREKLLCACLAELESVYDRSAPGGFQDVLQEWNARSTLPGRTVTVTAGGRETTGVVRGISRDGALVVRAGGTDRVFFAGEVTITMELRNAAGH